MNDKWGRNFLGTPPQGRADYAFFQHILASMDDKTGRCAILFPHGVLFRKEEQEIRKNLVEKDLIESVIGLGPNLFYNSPMEACIFICRTNKSDDYKNKIVFINAVNEVVRKNAESYLTDEHICRIRDAYFGHKDVENLCKIVSCEEVLNRNADLNISLYVTPKSTIIKEHLTEEEAITRWESISVNLHECFTTLLEQING